MELQEQFKQYIQKLIMDERAAATIQKYTHDICEFLQWYQSKCEENLTYARTRKVFEAYNTFEGFAAMIYLVAGKLELPVPDPF